MSNIHEKLYGVPAASNAEIEAVTEEVNRTFDRLSVGVVDLEPISFELFSEGMKALTAAGYSNFREMDSNAFDVWFETLKHLGQSLFSFTVNKILHSGRERFRTGRILLGDVMQIAEECYQEILITLREEADNAESDTPPQILYYNATKKMGLPRLSPSQYVHKQMMQQALPALISDEDRMSFRSLPKPNEEGIEMSEYDAQSHGVGNVF